MRWTRPEATLAVPEGQSQLALRLRNPAPFDRRVDIALDGRLADRVELSSATGWVPLRYDLGSAAGMPHQLALEVSPAWSPSDDYRTIGVGLAPTPWLRGGRVRPGSS